MEKEKLRNVRHNTQRTLLPDLGNKGLKMVLILVCPHFMREKALSKDAKCGRLFEAMMVALLDEDLGKFAWLFYELSSLVEDPKLVHITLYKNRVCLAISLCVFCMCAFGRKSGNCSI